jgi:hypothetical protein
MPLHSAMQARGKNFSRGPADKNGGILMDAKIIEVNNFDGGLQK